VGKRSGSGAGWEYPSAPAAVAAAVVDPEADKLSLLYAAVRLKLDGMSNPAIAVALGLGVSRIARALRDPRAAVLEKRLEMERTGEKGLEDAIQRARAEYRVARAWERLEAELDSKNEWLAHQSALAILAASARAQGQGGSATELVVSAGLAFDDQYSDDLQDATGADAVSPGLTAIDDD